MSDKEKILELIKSNNIEFIHLEYIDYVGLTRGRMIPINQLERVFETGVSFSLATLGFNSFDEFIPDSLLGVEDGDFYCVPDPSTFLIYPYRKNTARMLTNIITADGKPWEGCPRTMLRRVIQEAETFINGKLNFGFEQEAYLLVNNNGKFIPADNSLCFSTDGLDIQEDFVQNFVKALEDAGIEVVQISSEYGPAQLEINLNYSDVMTACDNQISFMQLFKQIARKHGFIGTLIPKPFEDQPGSGLHVHMSAFNSENKNLFFDSNDQKGLSLSETAYYFMGGILEHGNSIMAFAAPSINSYKRLQPGTFAPAHLCYGLGNRSALLRVTEPESSKRFEFRGADGTSNPYLLSAAIIIAGMDGLKNKLDPGEPLKKDAASLTVKEMERLNISIVPSSLGESLGYLSNNQIISQSLGEFIWKQYILLKQSEWIKYSKHVSSWELKLLTGVF